LKVDKEKIFNSTLSEVVNVLFETARKIFGELQAKKLFENAYVKLQKKYGVNLLQVLKVVPKKVLEAEKFQLLSKEEVEKTAKEVMKMDVLKGEFMNIAAHELKTPLVPIISYMQMLLDDKRLTPDQKEKIEISLASAKREVDLVSDILDISKLEAGSLKLELEKLNLVDLFHEIELSLEPVVKQKKLTFTMEYPDKLPIIDGDRRRLIQVVTNLVTNAVKFTEKGGITIKVKEQGKDILISVIDTGMGISKENVSKLFTKFFQADTTERRKQGGTGLGLAISKGIVEGHGGKIWIDSVLGKGSTFYFTLPVKSSVKVGASKSEERPVEPEIKDKHNIVLLKGNLLFWS